ncbi:hypothetical protein [Streptomyces sp. TS71-3]|uniref:hypothetical protein n=1 Tax=Streptomyces sp. TS71-3 TaxID=2733862 RepID=UPI001B14CC40|nr:hypothetical protein [Streptomyces sp. TS71-3]GHJ35573.1 hypothetical protein Sm713_11820 [Streptomyces sp. TS71-3]
MAYARALRTWGVPALMCTALLAGCTSAEDDGGGGSGGAAGGASASPSASGAGAAAPDADASAIGMPAASPTIETDPAKQPRNPAGARALVRRVIAEPELFGGGVDRAAPYESDPTMWAVLRDQCARQREKLPADVLATLTRHFEVPASGGKGSMRLTATVTVHRTKVDAAWEEAGMLQEALGCQEETLSPG